MPHARRLRPGRRRRPAAGAFWVHGGAFQTSAADYDGSVLAAGGPVVVVAVSYRPAPFGFLQLGTVEEPEPSPAVTDLWRPWPGSDEIAPSGATPSG